MANGYDPYDYLAGPMSPTQRRRAAAARLQQQLGERNVVRDELRDQNPITATAIDFLLGGGIPAAASKGIAAGKGILDAVRANRMWSNFPSYSAQAMPRQAMAVNAPRRAAQAVPNYALPASSTNTALATAGTLAAIQAAGVPPRPMTVRGANQWAGVNPEAGMDQMYAREIAAANAAFNDPEAGMDQMYAAEIAQSPKKPATKKVAAPALTKAQQKVFADAAKEYQSNSMPVLMQPQGPTKGGAAIRPQINWGTNQQGYDTMGDFGGNAADLLRADAMRKQLMEAGMGGLLG